MTKRTASDLITQAATRYPDNTTGSIVPGDADRPQHGDIADSQLNHLDLTNAAVFTGQGLRCNKTTGLVEPGGTIVANWTATQTTTYQALAGEAVIVDASGGDFTVTAPAAPSDGDVFAVKHISGTGVVTVDSGDALLIESQLASIAASTSVITYGIGNYVQWQYNAIGDVWLAVSVAKTVAWSEVWQGTAQTPMAGVAAPIVWTFVPAFVGQVSLIATHVGGTFAFSGDFDVRLNVVDSLVTFNLATNNSDAEYSITPVFSGAGIDIAPQFEDAFAHARLGSFARSVAGTGMVQAASGDTLRWDASSSGTGASNVDLTRINLILSVG